MVAGSFHAKLQSLVEHRRVESPLIFLGKHFQPPGIPGLMIQRPENVLTAPESMQQHTDSQRPLTVSTLIKRGILGVPEQPVDQLCLVGFRMIIY